MKEQEITKAAVYLIPLPLSENALHAIPNEVKEKAISIEKYFVENIRTARRYLKSIDKAVNIDNIEFSEMNQHTAPDFNKLKKWVTQGYDIGVMSEAGCPGIADPGAEVAKKAHEMGIRVIPFTGPNSLILSLMASGLNGQSFRFLGYLPIKPNERKNALKDLETISLERNETQLFIETPYRNNQLLQDILKHCKPGSLLCIARDVTNHQEEWILTQTIGEWRNKIPDLHKHPAVFLLLANAF